MTIIFSYIVQPYMIYYILHTLLQASRGYSFSLQVCLHIWSVNLLTYYTLPLRSLMVTRNKDIMVDTCMFTSNFNEAKSTSREKKKKQDITFKAIRFCE